MLGGDVLIETLANAGIEACFLNPGTTEVQSIVALERGGRIRPISTIFEAVATGAADGLRADGRQACDDTAPSRRGIGQRSG